MFLRDGGSFDTFDGEPVATIEEDMNIWPTVAQLSEARLIYVSQDLRGFAVDIPHQSADISSTDADGIRRAYRRLGAHWYAWLYHRVQDWSASFKMGQLPLSHWQQYHYRFNTLWHRLMSKGNADAHGRAIICDLTRYPLPQVIPEHFSDPVSL